MTNPIDQLGLRSMYMLLELPDRYILSNTGNSTYKKTGFEKNRNPKKMNDNIFILLYE